MDAALPVGVSLMLEEDFLGATLPLFEEGAVDVLEWSFDVGWGRELPAWAQGLLQHFAVSGRLLGHGVSFSPLSARWEEPQRNWLHRAALEVAKLKYRHVSEHFGFMAAGSFTRGSPMPMPVDAAVIRTGRDALSRLAEVTGLPVGLENLALALSSRDVDGQGDHLDALLEPVGGFVVLDLHNLWCQAVNFGRDPVGLLGRYPLGRVRELHVSGGSWSQPSSAEEPFRRDTHDAAIPDEVHALLPEALASCPHVEAVI
ncbi:MAG: DUF692 family protein, partial [Deltaproteobacteria bacterium]|nr:DUF692 family protein [Deltaproteobacteria bacterium]